MTYYITNPNRRCVVCGGREVLEVDEMREEVVNSSLTQYSDSFTCTNKKECRQNVDAANTRVIFRPGEGIKIKRYGETLFEAQLENE